MTQFVSHQSPPTKPATIHLSSSFAAISQIIKYQKNNSSECTQNLVSSSRARCIIVDVYVCGRGQICCNGYLFRHPPLLLQFNKLIFYWKTYQCGCCPSVIFRTINNVCQFLRRNDERRKKIAPNPQLPCGQLAKNIVNQPGVNLAG